MGLLQRHLQPLFTSALTSNGLRDLRRQAHELRRRAGDKPHGADLWLRADDPYAYLLLQALPSLTARFPLAIRLRLMRGTERETTPEPERLSRFSLQDARRLARWHDLQSPAGEPAIALVRRAEQLLATIERDQPGDGLTTALTVLHALWTDDAEGLERLAGQRNGLPDPATLAAHCEGNRQAQRRAGHYSSAMLQYGGEWYWGLDRLDHLGERLAALGLDRDGRPWSTRWRPDLSGQPLITDPAELAEIRALGATLSLFFSFRSPYSWVALRRTRALAAHYGLDLQLRPVLPMVMRGLPVPSVKRIYILLDTKREADAAGVPFGRLCDPVGSGAERCLAVCIAADNVQEALDFAEAGARRIWAEGLDMTDDQVLLAAAREAGISEARVRQALAGDDWRAVAEANRTALFNADLWGVPSLQLMLEDRCVASTWGQDRLWVVEDALRDLLRETAHA